MRKVRLLQRNAKRCQELLQAMEDPETIEQIGIWAGDFQEEAKERQALLSQSEVMPPVPVPAEKCGAA